MSSATLLIIQNDFVGRLMASDVHADVAIFQMRRALVVSEISQLLGSLKGRSGKIGTCIMVQMPVLDVVNPDLPGPDTTISQSMMVIEHPTLNSGGQGSGKSAEYLAEETLRLFHHFVPFGVTQVFVGGANAIAPFELEGLNAYLVTVKTLLRLQIPVKVVRPVITVTTTITITTDTAGAAIYYTTDGSYPSAENSSATLYSANFGAEVGSTIRASASKTGLQQSDIAQVTIS